MVGASSGTLQAGVDGELLSFSAPITVESVPLGLDLLLRPLEKGEATPGSDEPSEDAMAQLSGTTPVQWRR